MALLTDLAKCGGEIADGIVGVRRDLQALVGGADDMKAQADNTCTMSMCKARQAQVIDHIAKRPNWPAVTVTLECLPW